MLSPLVKSVGENTMGVVLNGQTRPKPTFTKH